uniref:Uncharacterized protein n=1 Tax=Opuntia streptacantha TaxID=393608 RepID=A0A7C9EBE8_OPUST
MARKRDGSPSASNNSTFFKDKKCNATFSRRFPMALCKTVCPYLSLANHGCSTFTPFGCSISFSQASSRIVAIWTLLSSSQLLSATYSRGFSSKIISTMYLLRSVVLTTSSLSTYSNGYNFPMNAQRVSGDQIR